MFKKIQNKIRQQVIEAYSAMGDEYDETHQMPWAGFEVLAAHVKKNAKVLDLGCGNGWVYGSLGSQSIDYIGIDNSSVMLEKAHSAFPEVRFELGDMVDLNLSNQSIDVVFSLAAFHHIPSRSLRSKSIQEIHRILKKDGLLILTAWNLFQWKFFQQWATSIFSFFFHLGLHYAWNDLWIPWRNFGPKRYFHAFFPYELLSYFPKNQWSVEDFFFVRKGTRVNFLKSFNICLILRKKNG